MTLAEWARLLFILASYALVGDAHDTPPARAPYSQGVTK